MAKQLSESFATASKGETFKMTLGLEIGANHIPGDGAWDMQVKEGKATLVQEEFRENLPNLEGLYKTESQTFTYKFEEAGEVKFEARRKDWSGDIAIKKITVTVK